MRRLSGFDVMVLASAKRSSASYRRAFDADVNVAMHVGIAGNESEYVSDAAKIGFVPPVSVFVVVGSLDDDDVSLERVARSGE